MPASIFHVKTNTVPDITNSGYGVLPSDWNSIHAVSMSLSGAEVIGAFANNSRMSFSTNGFGQIVGNFGNIRGTDIFGAFANNSLASVYTDPLGNVNISVNPANVTISAGGGSTAGNAIALLNGNGISFGLAGPFITASIIPGSTVFSGLVFQISGSSPLSTGTVVFSGSNISFSQIGNTIGFFGNPAQTNPVYSNNNGISFSTAGGTIQASYNPFALAVSGGNQTLTSGTAILYGSNAVTVSQNSGSITINAPIQTSLSFSNANNVSFTVVGSTLQASASQSVQPAVAVSIAGDILMTSGTVDLVAGSNITLSRAGQTISIVGLGTNAVSSQTVGISAGGNVQGSPVLRSSGTVVLAGGANVTLSQNQGTITINAGVSAAPISIQVPGLTNAVNAIQFSNGSGVSWGITGSTVTASVSQSAQPLTVFQNPVSSFTSNALQFGTAGNVSFSTDSNGLEGVASFVVTAGTTNQTKSNLAFVNSNGVSFGFNTANQITASVAPAGITVSASNTSNAVTAVTFSNSNNVSFGLSNGVLTASASYTTQTNYLFSNANGVSFGTGGGASTSVVTASVQTGILGISVIAGTTNNSTATALSFSNGGGISWQLSAGSQITASVAQQSLNFSAGTASNNVSNLVFSNSNGLSFGLSGSTITGSYTVPSQTTVAPFIAGNTAGNSTFTASSGSIWLLGGANLTISQTSNSFVFSAGTAAAASLSIGASNTTVAAGQLTFSNSNGVTFGFATANSALTASVNNVPALSLSASNTSATLPTLIFSNGNGVSWSLNTASSFIQASINTANTILVADANGSSASTNVVVFSNSNNVSFTLTNGSRIVGSASFAGINVSASASSASVTQLVFSNANGVTFGHSASTITASVSIPSALRISDSSTSSTYTAITLGTNNNLTLYMSAGSLLGSFSGGAGGAVTVAAGGSTNTVSNLTFTNANNVSFGLAGQVISASASYSQSTQPLTISASGGSYSATALSFSNAGNVNFSTSGSQIRASASIVLSVDGTSTGVSQVVFTDGNGVSWGLNGVSVTASVASQSSVVFSNANNVTFGLNAGSLTASASFPVQTSLNFSNANNITFGINAGTLTASFSAPAASLTVSASNASTNINQIYFLNSNNVSFGLTNGTQLTASIPVQSVQPITVSAPNGSYTAAGVSFANGGNVIHSTAAGSVVSANAYLNVSAGAGTSNSLSGLTFNNANGLTFGLSTGAGVGTITASYTVPTQTNQTISLALLGNTTLTSNGTFDARSLNISASTNVTVGFSNGTIILSGGAGGGGGGTISMYATGANTTVGTSGSNANSVVFSAAGGVISAGVSSNTVYISAPGSTSFSPLSVGISTQGNTAGTTGFFTNAFQVVGGSNITISQATSTNGATLSIIGGLPASQSISGSGNLYLTTTTNASGSVFIFQAPPLLQQQRVDYGNGTSTTLGQGSLVMLPLVNVMPFTATRLGWPCSASTNTQAGSTASSGGITIGAMAGLYSLTGSTLSLVTASSGVQTFGTTFTSMSSSNQSSVFSNWNGQKEISIGINVSYTGGDYWLGIFTTTSTANISMPLSFSNACQSIVASYNGVFGAAPAASIGEFTGLGVYSASTTSLPASIALTAINAGSNFNGLFPAFVFRNI